MSAAVTKKVAEPSGDDDMPSLATPGRFRRRPGRGANAGRRLVLPLSGVRKAAGLTQAELAEAAGMSQGDVSRFEGQADMRLSTLKRYADAIGATLEVAFVLPEGTRILLGEGPREG